MPTKPIIAPTFATDTDFAAGADPWSSEPNKVDPGSSRRAEGYTPDVLPAEWLNHQLHLFGAWHEWAEEMIDDVLGGDRSLSRTYRKLEGVPPSTGWSGDTEGALIATASSAPYGFRFFAGTDTARIVECISIAARVKPGTVRDPGDRMKIQAYTIDINGKFVSLIGSEPEDAGTTVEQSLTISLPAGTYISSTGLREDGTTPAPAGLGIRVFPGVGGGNDEIYVTRLLGNVVRV